MKYNSKNNYSFRLLELLNDNSLQSINKLFHTNYNKSGSHKIIMRSAAPEEDQEFITYKEMMEDARDVRV